MMYSYTADRRADMPELMDAPGVTLSELSVAHKELRVINRFLGGYSLLLDGIREVCNDREVSSLIDVGCGSGDNLRVIADHFRKERKKLRLRGVDLNPDAIEIGKSLSVRYPEIRYSTGNVWEPFGTADIITCSLFCHHFNDEQIVSLVNRLVSSAHVAVVINDLHRHWFAYHSISFLTKIFSSSRLVRNDAPLSVARSFSRDDWEKILRACDLQKYSLRWRWAWRWQLIIYK